VSRDVRDLLDDSMRPVDFEPEAEGIRQGDVFAARIIELDGRLQFMPGVLGVEAAQVSPLLARLHELHAAHVRKDWNQVTKENGELFHRMATPRDS
jgi:hypothetical protein